MTMTIDFLKKLLASPGPSSFEVAPSRLWRAEAARLTPQVDADVAGNSYATLPGSGGPALMLAGHIDEIGFVITHIDKDGFLWFAPLGGWDDQVVVGQRMRILSRDGDTIGVVGKKAAHLLKDEDRRTLKQLTPQDWTFMERMALHHHIPELDTVLVHGGFLPGMPWETQPAAVVTIQSASAATARTSSTPRLRASVAPPACANRAPQHRSRSCTTRTPERCSRRAPSWRSSLATCLLATDGAMPRRSAPAAKLPACTTCAKVTR